MGRIDVEPDNWEDCIAILSSCCMCCRVATHVVVQEVVELAVCFREVVQDGLDGLHTAR